MRVGLTRAGIGVLRRAMGSFLGCFGGSRQRSASTSTRKNKILAKASTALKKVSSRRDKAQVLPDTDEKTEVKYLDDAKAREQFSQAHEYVTQELQRLFSRPSNGGVRPSIKADSREHNETAEETCSRSTNVTAAAAGDSTPDHDQLAKLRRRKDSVSQDYLNIDAVFPESLFPEDDHRSSTSEKAGTSGGGGGDSDENSVCMSSDRKSQMSFDDKPILGLVSALWPDPAESEVKVYKAWDGKGIPNSTSKYKEDQMVNFQTTTFEARLERALAGQM